MTSERQDVSAGADQPPAHPGITLAAQREAMGWTVEHVAEQLKLAVRQIVAIEKADYAALPSPAVIRGFVRAYAKIVRLDPAPLVAMIPIDVPAPAEAGAAGARANRPASFSHSRYPTHGKRSALPIASIAGVLVVAAAGFAAWHFGLVKLPGSDTPPALEAAAPPPVETTTASAPANEPVHNPAVPLISVPAAAGDKDAAAAPAGTAATPAAATPPAGSPPGATASGTAPATASGTAPAAEPAATQAAAPGAATLVLEVREDSWIELRPQGGKALISRLVRAGSTETIALPGTATLVVGNPGAVTATLRGAPVALPPTPGKTTARVVLK